MRAFIQVLAIAIVGLGTGGCGSQSSAALQPATLHGPDARVVEFPSSAGTGEPREVHVLVDEPALKLVTITLRNGTELPAHQAGVPVTIHALQGAGTVVAGAERLRIDATHAVVLRSDVQHSVEPDAATDLVLLVYHLGRGEESHH